MNEAVPALKHSDATDTYRAATFIETYTGRAFWPLDPVRSKDALSVIDIAHALANQCRYSGHVRWFYSVAQHCCLLASFAVEQRGADPLTALQILMHDAPEAYLVDIPRPVKQYMPQYRVWDHAINDVIREWMGWSGIPIPEIIDDLDSRIIVDERAQLMDPAQRNDWGHKFEPVGVEILPWTPAEAEKQFLIQYAAYSKAVYGTYQYINHEWNLPVKVFHETGTDLASSKDIIDLVEVDIKGHVGRVRVKDGEGILLRDTMGGVFPRALTEWKHGKFEIYERG
jgi:hypothetical protein